MSLLEPVLADPKIVDKLRDVCGPEHVSSKEPDRIAYARDMWPRSLIRQRAGFLDHPPDIIVWPGNPEQVAQLVKIAGRAGLPVIPFGAGSGVCAGTLPVRGGIVVDLKRLSTIVEMNPEDSLLHVEAGIVGENLERELNHQGWTLGHFPSSIYCSTVGGWIAARSAGQCSSRYGKMEDLVRSLTFVDASGVVHTTPFRTPGFSPWSVDPLLVGSEGTLGIVVSATLVIRRLSEQRWFRGFKFPSVTSGLQAMRLILRRGLRPSVIRLYDEFDTVIAKTSPEDDVREPLLGDLGKRISRPLKGLFSRSLRRILMAPRLLNRVAGLLPGGCLLVAVQEGEEEERETSAALITEICRSQGAADLGEGPGRHWWNNRYSVSYKQSALFMSGAFVDTMEVATTWDRLMHLYQAVKKAVSGLAFIMAHFSHAYREGCSIYFTFAGAAANDAAAVTLYDEIWEAAQVAVLEQGGTISHHHGVGFSKQRYLTRQLAEANVLGDAVKQAFDPGNIFNPGKLGQRSAKAD